MNCETCDVRVRTEWCDLTGLDLILLNTSKVVEEYGAGEDVFQQGSPCDGLRYVASGMVATTRTWPGRTPVHINIRYPGDTLGLRAWLSGGNHLATARTLEPARTCLISGVALAHLTASHGAAMMRFLSRLASDLDIAEERLFYRSTLGARARLAKVLLAFRPSHGRPAEGKRPNPPADARGGLVVSLPLSRSQIAAAIGVSPAHLSRIIASLMDDGVARFRGRLVHITDPQRLLAEVQLSPRVNAAELWAPPLG